MLPAVLVFLVMFLRVLLAVLLRGMMQGSFAMRRSRRGRSRAETTESERRFGFTNRAPVIIIFNRAVSAAFCHDLVRDGLDQFLRFGINA